MLPSAHSPMRLEYIFASQLGSGGRPMLLPISLSPPMQPCPPAEQWLIPPRRELPSLLLLFPGTPSAKAFHPFKRAKRRGPEVARFRLRRGR